MNVACSGRGPAYGTPGLRRSTSAGYAPYGHDMEERDPASAVISPATIDDAEGIAAAVQATAEAYAVRSRHCSRAMRSSRLKGVGMDKNQRLVAIIGGLVAVFAGAGVAIAVATGAISS